MWLPWTNHCWAPTKCGTGHYRIGGEGVPETPSAHPSYADLAVAPVDEAEKPALHRTRMSVFD